jgi:hypothetical protein
MLKGEWQAPKDPNVHEDDVMCNVSALHDICIPLYQRTWCTKLVTTMTTLSTHSPKGNCLHTNICMGKSLTHQIGLKFKQIHACDFTCVLYKGLWVKFNHVQNVTLHGTNKYIALKYMLKSYTIFY